MGVVKTVRFRRTGAAPSRNADRAVVAIKTALPSSSRTAQGAALSAAFDDLLAEQKPSGLMVQLGDYPDVFQTAFADRMVRRPESASAQLHIYGQLEARLTESDRVILGGLVEGVWPPAPRVDPWLSRPMRHELGLDLPERRIGLSAHDFAQLLGTDDVILTHSAKVGGAPAVASRFLHRLEAVAGEARWDAAKTRRRKLCPLRRRTGPARQGRADRAARAKAAASRRGRLKLSVTAIEDWLRDPYTIYAKYILRLDPLDPVDMPLSAADRGSAIHDALGEFTQTFADALPATARAGAARHRRKIFRAADGAARGAGAVVAAVSAHRRMVCRLGAGAARRDREDRRRDPGRDQDSARQRAHLHAVGARRPDRAAPRRQLCDPRLQDRPAADRQTGAHGPVAAADAGGRDPARGRL